MLHGLRGHACVRLLRHGANTRQISDWVGMSEGMVKNYTKFSDQKDNAIAAVFLLDGTQAEQPHQNISIGCAASTYAIEAEAANGSSNSPHLPPGLSPMHLQLAQGRFGLSPDAADE